MPKLPPNKLRALEALMSSRSIAAAARAAKVGERTLWNWLGQDDFRTELRKLEQDAFARAAGRLQALTVSATERLGLEMDDTLNPSPVRVAAAKAVLTEAVRYDAHLRLEAELAALKARFEALESRKENAE